MACSAISRTTSLTDPSNASGNSFTESRHFPFLDSMPASSNEWCFRHQVLLRGCGQWYRCGRDRVARPSEQENLDPQPQRNLRRQEDVSKGEPSRGQTGLHSRSSDLTSELQSSVRSDEVVIATEQFHGLIEPLRRASVGKRSSRKVRRALPDGQIQPLDERRVQC